jgi:hypothetical protein
MIQLTQEQRQELAKGDVEAIDPQTSETYVLVPRKVYDRIKALLVEDEEWAQGGWAAAMEVFARDGWDDPRMDVYDSLDPRRQP